MSTPLAQCQSSLLQAFTTLAVLTLGGCGIPTSGPLGEAVEWQATAHVESESKKLPYCLVQLTPRVVDVVNRHRERLAGQFTDRQGPATVQIGIGDVLTVTLFESAAGGLFFPIEGGLRNGNFLTLPNQIVDNKGDITIPYAGAIRAAGHTPQEIQTEIVDALKNRALEPQAVVTVVERRNEQITVLGDIGTGLSQRLPASLSGERVLDVISRAGGLRGAGQDTWVLVDRNHKVAVAPFEALVFEPANNIYVRGQDVVYLYKEPQTFLVFGATGKQGQIQFEAWRLTLAEGLAKAGGLLDDRAEPGWVFLYRSERQKVAQELGAKCAVTDGPYVPVIYEIDLRSPPSMFLATQFPMRNKDVIYASNARSVEGTKFMNYIRLFNATLQDPINTAISAYALKAAINGTSSSAVLVGGTH